MQEISIETNGNRIEVLGTISGRTYKRLLAAIHAVTTKAGYSEVRLSMTRVSAAFPAPMLSICAQLIALREAGIYCELDPPEDARLRNLFSNANWAHLIDPRRHDTSRFRGRSRLPATTFRSAAEQQTVVNQIVSTLLESMPGIERSQFAAFEWAVNEVTDNVLIHSGSRVGGLVQVSMFDRAQQIVEFDVCDPGLGIPATLREGYDEIRSDSEALDRAIREGITRDKQVGQGNGLYGSYQICALSKGAFQLHSGYASLMHSEKDGLHVYPEQIPFSGTLVIGRINFSAKGLLENALKFGGRPFIPVDYIGTHYEDGDGQTLVFRLFEEVSSFGSRISGAPLRNKLRNLLAMSQKQCILIDFEGVPILSSSFADEVFGKLFVELGPLQFGARVRFQNVPSLIANLIEKAILQRSADSVARRG